MIGAKRFDPLAEWRIELRLHKKYTQIYREDLPELPRYRIH